VIGIGDEDVVPLVLIVVENKSAEVNVSLRCRRR
jgi:hypothetical protein